MTAWAILVAVEEGVVSLDQPVGQPGCTLRHLLAHAGGYPFDGDDPIARPEATRIYSNSGFSLAARAVEDATDMTFADYLARSRVRTARDDRQRAARVGRARRAIATSPTRAGSSPK